MRFFTHIAAAIVEKSYASLN